MPVRYASAMKSPASRLASIRWKKTPKSERVRIASEMGKASGKSRAKSALAKKSLRTLGGTLP